MEWLHYVPVTRVLEESVPVTIVPYQPQYREAFRVLNEEWLTEYMEIEPEDARVLADPEGTIIAGGGAIIVALDEARPIGTGALINEGDGKYELAKMAVTGSYRGQGIGRQLAERLIEMARTFGAREVELVSATLLPAATPLYRKLGFVEIPLGDNPYTRADIRMIKTL